MLPRDTLNAFRVRRSIKNIFSIRNVTRLEFIMSLVYKNASLDVGKVEISQNFVQ